MQPVTTPQGRSRELSSAGGSVDVDNPKSEGHSTKGPVIDILIVIAASIVVGFFAFVILASVLLVLAAIVSIRLWWFRRKMMQDPAFRASRSARRGGSQETIEGEYHVVIEERRDRKP